MNYYNKIKKELINNEITKKAKDYSKNRSDLNTYYNVGKMLSEAGKHYGKSILKDYSIRLSQELNNKYDVSYLNKMKNFIYSFKNWRHCRQNYHTIIMLNFYHSKI